MKRKKLLKQLAWKANQINMVLYDVITLIDATATDDDVKEALTPHIDTDNMALTFGAYAKELASKQGTVYMAIRDLLEGQYVEADIQDAIDC